MTREEIAVIHKGTRNPAIFNKYILSFCVVFCFCLVNLPAPELPEEEEEEMLETEEVIEMEEEDPVGQAYLVLIWNLYWHICGSLIPSLCHVNQMRG